MLGRTIDEIRRKKKITIKEMIGDRITYTSYQSFRNESMDIRLEHVIHILNRINVLPSEVMPLLDDLNKMTYFYTKGERIIDMYHQHRLDLLEKEKEEIIALGLEKKFIESIYWTIDYFIHEIKNEKIAESEIEKMKQFFLQIETWYRYELYLFASVGEVFLDAQFLIVVFMNLKKVLRKTQSRNQGLALNCVHIVFLNAMRLKDHELILLVLEELNSITISERFLYEQQYTVLFNLLYQYYWLGKEGAEDQAIDYATSLDYFNCSHVLKIARLCSDEFALLYQKPALFDQYDQQRREQQASE